MSFKKAFAFLMVLPLFTISSQVWARGHSHEGHEVHGKSQHKEMHHKHEAKKEQFAETSTRRAEKIAKQNERKIKNLDAWKTKKVEKCAGDQKCLDRVEKQYSKRKEQIDKQHEAQSKALEEFNKKHEVEGTESGEATEPTETESPEKSETPEAPENSTE